MKKKGIYIIFPLFFLFFILISGLYIYYFYFIKPEVFSVRRLSLSAYHSSLLNDKKEFLNQIDEFIKKTEQKKEDNIIIADTSIPKHIVIETLRDFSALMKKKLDSDAFEKEFFENFNLYKINTLKKKVLFTGYFMPEINASLEKGRGYEYPLYGAPPDLVKINLSDFDYQGNKNIWGIIKDNKVMPFYTRYDIDWEKKPVSAPVLAWIKTPVEGIMLHIQGSGILKFDDNKKKVIHYAANNGHKYGSICNYFIEKNILNKDNCTWENINNIWENKKEEFIQACKTNPRYIFFEWQEREGATGSSGLTLLREKSIALDPAFYPFGLPVIIDNPDFRGFTVNMDTGAAIKGQRRVDIYFGEGSLAGKKAEKMKSHGNLYFFLKKNPLLEGVKGWR